MNHWGLNPTAIERKRSLQRSSAVFSNAWSVPEQRLPATPLGGLESWPKPRETRTEQLWKTIVRQHQWPTRPTCPCRFACTVGKDHFLAFARGLQSEPFLVRCSSPGNTVAVER